MVSAVFSGTLLISLAIVALQKTSSFDKMELRAFTILKRIKVRQSLRETLIKIIQVNVRIYQKKMTIRKMRELLQMPEYLDLIRKRQALKEKKNNYLRDINKDNFTNDDDKFLDLEPRIDEDIHIYIVR